MSLTVRHRTSGGHKAPATGARDGTGTRSQLTKYPQFIHMSVDGAGTDRKAVSSAKEMVLMADKAVMKEWVVEALEQLGGAGSIIEVCRVVWQRHEADLRASGDLFYTWQYDIRWAATKLRHDGLLAETAPKSRHPWRLADYVPGKSRKSSLTN